MKSITKLAFGAVLAAALVVAPEATAQSEQQGRARQERGQRMDPAQRVERRVSMMTERLQLSQPQATQIRQTLTQESEQMRAIFEKGQNGGDREGLRPEIRSLREGTEKKIEAVLTEPQRKSYAELREQMRQRRDERGARKGTRKG
jgi:Spy/CpxP family protein refolding chaperone